jgi:nucleotide-binding universal stress UspA family protein
MYRILVAYDGGAPAKRALETAIELAKQSDGLMTVVSVVPTHAGRSPIDPWDDGAVHARELQAAPCRTRHNAFIVAIRGPPSYPAQRRHRAGMKKCRHATDEPLLIIEQPFVLTRAGLGALPLSHDVLEPAHRLAERVRRVAVTIAHRWRARAPAATRADVRPFSVGAT